MNEYEVQVSTIAEEHGRNDYIVKANSSEEAIQAVKEGKAETVWYKSYGFENEIELWDEVRVKKL